MNLKTVLERIPLITRSRFAANGNASWLQWAADIIARIDQECPGTGNIKDVQALPMVSGFIPRPAVLKDITHILVDGSPVEFEKNSKGIRLIGDTIPELTSQKVSCTVSGDTSETSTVTLDTLADAVSVNAGVQTVTISAFTSSTGHLQLDVGDGLPEEPNGLAGWFVTINGAPFRIKSNSAPVNGYCTFEVVEATSIVIIGSVSGQSLLNFEDNCFVDWSVAAGTDQYSVAGSKWATPVETPTGWSSRFEFLMDVDEPIGTFAGKTGTLFTSNIILRGYRVSRKPTSITEELDIDEAYCQLLALGMHMMAERDMEPGGRDAQAREVAFLGELKRYRIDRTQARGKAAPKRYSFTPRFGGNW